MGNLHDCRVTRWSWDLVSRTGEILIEDMYANFAGLPEYAGPQAGRLRFRGLQHCIVDAVASSDLLNIDECVIEPSSEQLMIRIVFWPSGQLRLICAEADWVEL